MLRAIYIYFFGGGSSRIWLLYRCAKRLNRIGYRRLARFVNSTIEKDYGCYISLTAEIHPSVEFRHPVGIVIGAGVKVGRNTIIYQGVTLGGKELGDWKNNNYPKVGCGVTLFAGAKLLGNILIGDGAVVGANSVVIKDVCAGGRVVGVPARSIA